MIKYNNNYQINKNINFIIVLQRYKYKFFKYYLSLIKIEDIKVELKINILSKKINNEKRFIVFDDIDLFNLNCANALLKMIEEPLNKDYFFLINNKTQNLIETINSRCIEFKIDMNFKGLNNNIQEFLKQELKPLIDFDHKF